MSGTLLLHACCAPCAAPSLETVNRDEWSVVLFFSNSNIYPRSEYELRLGEIRRLAAAMDVPLVEDEYDHDCWREAVQGLEGEPERGERCRRCFEFNLRRAAATAACMDLNAFTTTLTVSPHKNYQVIRAVGQSWPGFVPYDFKKNDGFRRGIELSRQYGLYRQDYCGCEFSLQARKLQQQKKDHEADS